MEDVTGTGELLKQVRRVSLTAVEALHNRAELFLVELQEEGNRVLELFIWAAAAAVLALIFLVAFTWTVILLVPEHIKPYAAGGLCLLYGMGAIFAVWNIRSIHKNSPPPFSATLSEVKKDHEWLESLE